jgi:hypothetical protein
MIKLRSVINESMKSERLADEINDAMERIDDSMHYKDFALAVASVLKSEYGTQNHEPFIEELKNQLDSQED